MNLVLTAEERAYYKSSLLNYILGLFKYYYKTEFIPASHHVKLATAMERIILGDLTNLLIAMPPRHSKTLFSVLGFITYSLGLFPSSHFIHASYSALVSTKNSHEARDIVESDYYQQLFPNVKTDKEDRSKGDWSTTLGGALFATSVGGGVTGIGAGVMSTVGQFGGAIIVDDPNKASEAESDTKRSAVNEWFINSLISRRNNTKLTPMIIIQQRVHMEDLIGFLLNGGSQETWEYLKLPILNEDGSPLWEYMHSLESIERLRKSNTYVFQSQYMQDPIPSGGSLFKEHWFNSYVVKPDHFKWKLITCDTAMRAKEYNDYTVFILGGVVDDEVGKRLYILDVLRGKWEIPDLKKTIMTFYNHHQPSKMMPTSRIRAVYVEDKMSGIGLIDEMRRKRSMPIVPIPRNKGSGDKVARAYDIMTYIEMGAVYLPQEAPWLAEFKAEILAFSPTMSHKHDDQVDALVDMVNIVFNSPSKVSSGW